MGVATRRPKAAPYFEASKRAVSDLYHVNHVEQFEAAARALAVQWYVQNGGPPPGWMNPPGLEEALARAEAELAPPAAAGDGSRG